MVRALGLMAPKPVLLLALLVASTAAAARPEMRQERALDFAPDEAFQRDGGVQFFYALEPSLDTPPAGSAWAQLRALDDKAATGDAFQIVMSRIVYTVNRDVSYFSEARARDTKYLAAVAPEMKVTAEPGGSFRVGRMPSNSFRLTWFDAPSAAEPSLTAFFSLLPKDAAPRSIVVQRNSDFSRVMGWRTAERAITYTAHYALSPGVTRIYVVTLSLLYHVPPFFLGGRNRVYREAVDETAALIEALREYRGP